MENINGCAIFLFIPFGDLCLWDVFEECDAFRVARVIDQQSERDVWWCRREEHLSLQPVQIASDRACCCLCVLTLVTELSQHRNSWSWLENPGQANAYRIKASNAEAHWQFQRTHSTSLTLVCLFRKWHSKSMSGTGVFWIYGGDQSTNSALLANGEVAGIPEARGQPVSTLLLLLLPLCYYLQGKVAGITNVLRALNCACPPTISLFSILSTVY